MEKVIGFGIFLLFCGAIYYFVIKPRQEAKKEQGTVNYGGNPGKNRDHLSDK